MNDTIEQTVVKLKTEDFLYTLDEWCEGNKFPNLHLSILPENVYVYSDEGIYTHCVFVYETNSAICWLSFPVANPFIDKGRGRLSDLFLKVENLMKDRGYSIMFTTSSTPKVKGVLNSLGYLMGDENVNHYFKTVN